LRDGEPWDEVVPAWFVLVGVWVLGRWIRHRRLDAAALAQRADAAERESERRSREAVVEERARIARELHDLVAHSMGVIVLQAQGAQRTLDHDPARTRAALEDIEGTGRNGLAEMRRLLGLLTGPTEAAPAEPQPSLGQLGDLMDRVRAAGTPVTLDVRGEVRDLPPGVELTAYRVVQESLTNALKHAPGAPVHVRVDYGGDSVQVSVTDDGARVPEAAESGGRGMVGMRERVALYDGELVAGPRAEGGFAVSARLPAGGGA
jgi:signal transduction histidine kinase